ncbi:MAG TPA: PQQ-binding-like beta-propeller repeat protein [Thermoleophilaceae bacterium]|jgi:polyvinyl alcohol dehydrogenase (cytochrome)
MTRRVLKTARTTGIAAAAALVLGIAAAPAAADWPMYGHDLDNTRNAGRDGPSLQAAAQLKEAWRFPTQTETDFTGTPVIADGLVVAGDFGGTVYALDAVTGKLRWKKDLEQPINASAAIDMNAEGGPTVYVPLQDVDSPRVAALYLKDGKLRWNTVLTNQPTSSMYGSPVVWKGNVYVGTSGPNGDGSTARGTVVSLNGESGAVRWRTFTVPEGHDGGPVWSTPAIDTETGRLYVGTGNAYHDPAADTTDAILALDTDTGQILKKFQATPGDVFPENPIGEDVDFGASPNLMRSPTGQALVGDGAKDGNYYALDRETFNLVWQANVGPGSAAGGFIGSLPYDGTRVYGVNALTSEVAAINPDGSIKWSNSEGGSPVFGTMSMGNGLVYTLDSSGDLTAREALTGTVVGTVDVGKGTWGGISLKGGAVYVTVGMGPLPPPAPQSTQEGAIVAFGDTSRSGVGGGSGSGSGGSGGGSGGSGSNSKRRHIRLRVKPRRAVAGRRTVYRFRTFVGDKPLAGALIRFAGRHRRTDRKGRARMAVRLHRGPRRARAIKRGFKKGSVKVRVRRR